MSTLVKDESTSSQAEPLKWEVFVTPGIPITQAQRPEGVQETFFQAMASTLIYGKHDAILVDAFMTVKQATALADWVASKHKNLTTIYITHGHGDHWFGVGTILGRFPNARVVATPNTIKVMQGNASPQGLAAWRAGFPGQIPETLVMAEELQGHMIDLEGRDVIAVTMCDVDGRQILVLGRDPICQGGGLLDGHKRIHEDGVTRAVDERGRHRLEKRLVYSFRPLRLSDRYARRHEYVPLQGLCDHS